MWSIASPLIQFNILPTAGVSPLFTAVFDLCELIYSFRTSFSLLQDVVLMHVHSVVVLLAQLI